MMTGPGVAPVAKKMSFLDRWLALWILMAMAVGLLLGRFIPGLDRALDSVKIGGISVPIAIGLLVMMYPVLAKVRYDETDRVTGDRKLLTLSLFLNWIAGPAFMFTLAWVFLPDLPEFRTGLIIVGLARCIAMVFIWNDLACGDREAAAVLVAINSVFQVVMFSVLGWFYLTILPGWLGLDTQGLEVSMGQIALNVLVFLGVPLVAGFASRWIGEKRRGRDWYEEKFLPRIGPWALYGLLFTIVLLFALQGEAITSNPWDVARIALPLLAYFVLMFGIALLASKAVGLNYAKHIAEMGHEQPDVPTLFIKFPEALIGAHDDAEVPSFNADTLDFEGELAVIIGRMCKDIEPEEAKKVIFGYTIANDVTARDLQKGDGQWARAKGMDTFCPLGPWIETDLDPQDVSIVTRLDGEVAQDGHSSDMVHGVAALISHASKSFTLLPGDVILTGTPAGVGLVDPGQRVEIDIDAIGTLANPFVASE